MFDRDGNLYVTYSGTRGLQVPVSIFRVRPNGTRETFSSGIVNPTSVAVDPEDRIYVSSRFEGTVYRLTPTASRSPFATDLGVACGLAFAPDGTLFVGDRSGTIFKVDRSGKAEAFATLPPSVAAFHLALGSRRALYVTGPTLSPYDAVYRVDAGGDVTIRSQAFGTAAGPGVRPVGSAVRRRSAGGRERRVSSARRGRRRSAARPGRAGARRPGVRSQRRAGRLLERQRVQIVDLVIVDCRFIAQLHRQIAPR